MINKDSLNTTQLEIAQRISNAAKEGNQEEFEAGLQDLFANIHDEIIAEANAMKNASDATILAQRGVRQLTSEERDFYNNVIDKMKAAGSANPMMALTNTDKTFPLTIITQVMEDMKQEHPLLAAVDTVSVSGLAKILVNADGGDNATWGALESTITKEIDSAFKEIDMSQNKLSAWMPISIDMLELGANWLDTYIRTCLSEALAIGFENGIVTGTGKDMPIGMDRQVQDDVVITAGVYPQKNAIAVTDLKPATYGNLISMLAKNEQGKNRAVRDLILVCNPQDYFKIVMPATTIMTPDGKYVNDVLPYPTKIIPSVACAADEAILGMGKRYFLGVGGKRGIQFSDDYKFLEDKRYYKIVAYANGRAKDNNSFLRLDISGLKRLVPEVITIDPANFLVSLDVKADVHASVLGYTVSNLQSGVTVTNNEISGTLAYVDDFTGFSGDPELQKGNFLALSFDSDPSADKMTVEFVGAQISHGEQELDSDKDCVFRVTDKDAQSIVFRAYKKGEVTRRTYNLKKLVLESGN